MNRSERPWGWFDNLEESQINIYKVKTIYVNPNQQFSLQLHNHREEHWVVVEGDGIVTTSTCSTMVKRGDYVHISKNEVHRMKAGTFGIKFIEVQIGSVCDEDDIVRLEDDYGRS